MQRLQCVCMSFDHPLHDLGAKPQPPAGIQTVLRTLTLPGGAHGAVVFNALVDHGHMERVALVKVTPALSRTLPYHVAERLKLAEVASALGLPRRAHASSP